MCVVCVHTDITIYPLAVLEDNYSYLIVDSISKVAVVVDPADPVIVEVRGREREGGVSWCVLQIMSICSTECCEGARYLSEGHTYHT